MGITTEVIVGGEVQYEEKYHLACRAKVLENVSEGNIIGYTLEVLEVIFW